MLKESFEIAGRKVGAGAEPYVIAEVGSNFNQSRDIAKALIDCAAEAGVDAVKFQLFNAESLYPDRDGLYDLFKSIELNADWLPALASHAEGRGVHFFCSVFDPGSADSLDALGVPAIKVASSETTNLPLLHKVASKGRPLIVSVGMCDWVDVEEAVAVCLAAGNDQVALLQCGAIYPLPPELANLRVIPALADRFACPVGFSDHTRGHAAAPAAIGLGAAVIEKHFTLDRSSEGPDHFYALEPEELKAYVGGIREAYAALGSPVKAMLPAEREQGRRDGLYAARDLSAGEVIDAEAISIRRPAVGLRARYKDAIIGARSRHAVGAGTPLNWSDIEF